jgi:hypothetical protein
MAAPRGRRPKQKQQAQPAQSAVDTIKTNKNDLFFIPHNFARSKLEPLYASSTNTSVSAYTVTQINDYLKNPYNNYSNLQKVSDYIYNTNSIYGNYLDYFVNLIPFYFMLFPMYTTDKADTTKNRMLYSAQTIFKMQLENIAPKMLKRVLKDGEAYFYDLSDSENTIIDDIPKEICVLSHIDDDSLWRYYIDFSKVNPNTLTELPSEIQVAYKAWEDNKKPKTKTEGVPDYYFQVSKRGFAIFAHMIKKTHDYPYFASTFADLTMLTDDKSYFNTYIKDDALKLIHQEIPTNKESGEPLMDKDLAQIYHTSAKENVGQNISIITSPFKVTGIAIDKNSQSAMNVVKHDLDVLNANSGISTTVFSADTTNGLGFSTTKDAGKMYPLLYFFNNFVNYKIKQYKCLVQFLHVNIFDKEKVHEKYRTDLLDGGSRIAFMGTAGIELFAYLSMLQAEQELKYDDLLVPKLNASQSSAEDLNANGRPAKKPEDASDSTTTVNKNK